MAGSSIVAHSSPKPRVLLLVAHPRAASLCGAIADAYAEGARQAGIDLRRCDLNALRFEPNVTAVSPADQFREEDIQSTMHSIVWADHLVFVFPTWWGTMPALLKAFLDRVLIPGFAFADRDDDEGWDRLLAGRSAHLLTTMDTPPWVYRWIYGAPGLNGLARATLGFCGIAPVRRTVFGPVKGSCLAVRQQWIADARLEGSRLRDGALGPAAKLRRNIAAWATAIRPQFHPMAWIAYLIGALCAWHIGLPERFVPFWIGLACLFSLEAATVFANDYFDYETDVRNRHHGPFTGGSRMLVEGRISPARMRVGIAIALTAFVMLAALVCRMTGAATGAFLAVNAVLALGYTVPPLKLCWRGLGELDVALTHGFSAMVFGALAQGASFAAPLPWLIGLPLFWAVLPAIVLSGVPDFDADKAAGKRSLAVRHGPAGAVIIAELATAAAAASSITWLKALGMVAMPAMAVVVVYAALLVFRLERYRDARVSPRRIDGLMALGLGFIVVVALCPLVLLLSALRRQTWSKSTTTRSVSGRA